MKRCELVSHCDQQVHPHMNFMFLEMEESRKKSDKEMFELKGQLSEVFQHLKDLESSEKQLKETVTSLNIQLTHSNERLAVTLKDFNESKKCTNDEFTLTKEKLAITLKDLKETKMRLSEAELKLNKIEGKILFYSHLNFKFLRTNILQIMQYECRK